MISPDNATFYIYIFVFDMINIFGSYMVTIIHGSFTHKKKAKLNTTNKEIFYGSNNNNLKFAHQEFDTRIVFSMKVST